MLRRGLLLLSVVGLLSEGLAQVAYWDIRPMRPTFTTREKPVISLGYQGVPAGLQIKVFAGERQGSPILTLHPTLSPNGKKRYTNQTIAVPVTRPGQYWVEAAMGRQTRDFNFYVSNLGLVVKRGPDKTTVWVVNRLTGKPQPGATVTLLRGEGEATPLVSGATGADGLWSGPSPGSAFIARAQLGAHVAEASEYYYRDEEGREGSQTAPIYVYTDRPVYRPGDTVSFKGIAREWSNGSYTEFANHPVSIEVKDQNRTSILTQETTTSEMGTFDGSFTLSNSAPPGDYHVLARVDASHVGSAYFDIAEYRKPEYKVSMKMVPDVAVSGEPMVARVDAKYYFGGPVPNSHVRWSAYVRPAYGWYAFRPAKPDDEPEWESKSSDEEEGGSAPGYGWGEVHLEGTGMTDRNGVCLISVPTTFQKRFEHPITVEVTAEMIDISGRAGDVSAEGTVLPSTRFVDVDFRTSVGQLGDQAVATLTTVNPLTRKPEPNISFKVQLVHVQWIEQGRKWREQRTVKETRSLRSGPDGSVEFAFSPDRPGTYELNASVQDGRGRVGTSEDSFWVYGDVEGWYWGGSGQLSVIPSAHRARIGETVTFLFRTPAATGAVYYAVEGSAIHQQGVLQARGNVARLTVPVTPELIPSFTVWAGTVSDGLLSKGQVSIGVTDPSKILNIELKPVENRYMPGDTASYQVSVHDIAGNPVGAEFSLGVVDESIYAIRSEKAEDIRNFYYGPKGNQVSTSESESLNYRVPLAMGRVQEKDVAMAKRAEQRAKEGRVRRVFKDTAFWAPKLQTDPAGQATVPVPLPDNLTQWRATLRAVGPGTSVGQAVNAEIRVTKPLIASLDLPRFCTQGDRFHVIAVVRNTTSEPQEVLLGVQVDGGIQLASMPEQHVMIPAGSEWRHDVLAIAQTPGVATIEMTARSGQHEDTVDKVLSIRPFANWQTHSVSGTVLRDVKGTLPLPAGRTPGSETVSFRLAPSVFSLLVGSVDKLAEYPYGCIEQTTSPTVGDLALLRLVKASPNPDPERVAKLSDMINVGIQRMAKMQEYNGGWGWGDHADSDAYWTAYVMDALRQARDAGFTVPDTMWKKGLRQLGTFVTAMDPQKPVREPDEEDWQFKRRMWQYHAALHTKAAGLLTLCLGDPPSWKAAVERMASRTADLSPTTLADLARALQAAGSEERARTIFDLMVSQHKESGAMAYWPSDRAGSEYWEYFGEQDTFSTATALRAMLKMQPQSPIIDKCISWLMANRQWDGWYSTNDTARIIQALCDWTDVTGSQPFVGSVSVFVNGKPVLDGKAVEANTGEIAVEVPRDLLKPAGNTWEIRIDGQGTVRYTATTRYTTPYEQRRGTEHGIAVERTYHRLVKTAVTKTRGRSTWTEDKYSLAPMGNVASPGDQVVVKLVLTMGVPMRHILLEDPIPAGLEPIDEEDSEYLYADWLYGAEGESERNWYGYSRRESHDDRVAMLIEDAGPGRTVYYYVLRAVTPGAFRAAAPTAYQMYMPSVSGSGPSGRMQVTPR